MNNILVSIIVPVYNKEIYLEDCFDSICKQTTEEIEVIIVDDGSTDRSLEIIDIYVKKDSRFRVIHCQHKGASAARNIGVKSAKGKYLAFVDSDDIIESDYIAQMVDSIGNYDLCISGFKLWDQYQNKWKSIQYPSKKHTVDGIGKSITRYGSVLGSVSWKLFRREIVLRKGICFPEEISYGEDTLFFFKYLSNIKDFVVISNASYIYRKHDKQSLSSAAIQNIAPHVTLISELDKFLKKNKIMTILHLINYWQVGQLFVIGKIICYHNMRYINKKKRFFEIVRKYEFRKKCMLVKIHSVPILIVKLSVLTNMFFPFILLIKTVGKVKKWDLKHLSSN